MIFLRIKNCFSLLLKKLGILKNVYYINGSETLPAPLTSQEEKELLLRFDEEIEGNILAAAYKSETFVNRVKLNPDNIVILGDICMKINKKCASLFLSAALLFRIR